MDAIFARRYRSPAQRMRVLNHRIDPAIESAGAECPTVLASWTAVLTRALERAGLDGLALAEQAGIDPTVFEQPGRRISLPATTRLWDLAVEATGDPAFGLSVAYLVRPSTFAGLSMGMVVSTTLQEAFERLKRFQTVVLAPAGRMDLSVHGETFSWTDSFPGPSPAPSATAMEALLASIVLCGRFLSGRSFSPTAVRLMREDHPRADVLADFFRCPITWGANHYRLEFSLAEVTRPLPTGSPELARIADELAASLISRLPESTGLIDRVRALTIALAAEGQADKATIAASLAMSPRTLQRRLEHEGTTLIRLMTEARRDRASELLALGSLTVAEVAHQLGFHDASSFRRAFKRWTGQTPAHFVDAGTSSDLGAALVE
jgi:AraC-like DNA-binding protein